MTSLQVWWIRIATFLQHGPSGVQRRRVAAQVLPPPLFEDVSEEFGVAGVAAVQGVSDISEDGYKADEHVGDDVEDHPEFCPGV